MPPSQIPNSSVFHVPVTSVSEVASDDHTLRSPSSRLDFYIIESDDDGDDSIAVKSKRKRDGNKDHPGNTKRRKGTRQSVHKSCDARAVDRIPPQPSDGRMVASTRSNDQSLPHEAPASTSWSIVEARRDFIKTVLPQRQPGMFPSELADRIKTSNPHLVDDESATNQVRDALKKMLADSEVSRQWGHTAKGPPGYRYIFLNNERTMQSPRSEMSCRHRQTDSPVGTGLSPVHNHQLAPPTPLRKSAEDCGQLASNKESTAQHESFERDNRDISAVSAGAEESQPPRPPTKESNESRAEVVSSNDHLEKEDPHPQDDPLILGQVVLLMRNLKAAFQHATRQARECKAQLGRDQAGHKELKSQAREATVIALTKDTQAQKLRDQLTSVEREAAEHRQEANRLELEAEEKMRVCDQGEATIAELDGRRSEIGSELLQVEKRLDIDWKES